MKIVNDDLTGPEIKSLLEEHLDEMRQHSPPKSIHALDLDKLREPEIQFWSVWADEELVGCGALKSLETDHAEIKSMRVAYKYQGKGIANLILEHLIGESRRQNINRLSLETGSTEVFNRARNLYLKYGFEYCLPFGSYQEDPNSVFMTRLILSE